MKQKLSKAGLLRKLIDNLISHKNKIYDSLNHNNQIVLQNSKISAKYAGLLIIDQIVHGVYQSLKSTINNDSDNFTSLSNHHRSEIIMQPAHKNAQDLRY